MTDWLFYTLHPGSAERLDAVVEHVVAPSVATALAGQEVRRWFFLRYTDELGPHVRLRFAGAVDRLQRTLDASLDARLAQVAAPGDGHVGAEHALYEPEYGKFGGVAGVASCERAFQASSALVLALCGTVAWAPLERRAAGLGIMARTLGAAGVRDARSFWERYGWYWSGAARPGAGALRTRVHDAAARQAPALRALADELEPALPQPVEDYLAVVAAVRHELRGRLDAEPYAFQLVHLMNNRLGIAILEEAFLAAVLAGPT